MRSNSVPIPAMVQRVSPYDFRHSLETRVLVFADLDRVPLIETLIALDIQARQRARPGRRAARGTLTRALADQALAESDRLGRVIHFLRFRSFATSSTSKDELLCTALAEKLTAKGQWRGEYSL